MEAYKVSLSAEEEGGTYSGGAPLIHNRFWPLFSPSYLFLLSEIDHNPSYSSSPSSYIVPSIHYIFLGFEDGQLHSAAILELGSCGICYSRSQILAAITSVV